MKTNTRKWLYGLGSAAIGGGSGAVVSGVTVMGFAPDKFNLVDSSGVFRLVLLTLTHFLFSGVMAAFFYLKQSPLPPESGDTQTFVKLPTQPPQTSTATCVAENKPQ